MRPLAPLRPARRALRYALIAALPLFVLGAPSAEAKKDLPGGCDLFANTHCHCIGTGALNCFVEPID